MVDGAQACRYLRLTPLLVELTLRIKKTKATDLKRIISGSDGICPRLTSLYFDIDEHFIITPGSLTKTLQARFDKNQSITIRLRFRCTPKVKEPLMNDPMIAKIQRDYAFKLEFGGKSFYGLVRRL